MADDKIMTPEAFTVNMRNIAQMPDVEDAHGQADELMCELLRSLGYEEGVKLFERMDKWYA